jgi:hypothetical protein
MTDDRKSAWLLMKEAKITPLERATTMTMIVDAHSSNIKSNIKKI